MPRGGSGDLTKETTQLSLPIVFDLQHVVEMDFAAGQAVLALAKSIAGSGQAQLIAFEFGGLILIVTQS